MESDPKMAVRRSKATFSYISLPIRSSNYSRDTVAPLEKQSSTLMDRWASYSVSSREKTEKMLSFKLSKFPNHLWANRNLKDKSKWITLQNRPKTSPSICKSVRKLVFYLWFQNSVTPMFSKSLLANQSWDKESPKTLSSQVQETPKMTAPYLSTRVALSFRSTSTRPSSSALSWTSVLISLTTEMLLFNWHKNTPFKEPMDFFKNSSIELSPILILPQQLRWPPDPQVLPSETSRQSTNWRTSRTNLVNPRLSWFISKPFWTTALLTR